MNRNFGLLLSGQLVSQIGDKFHMLAVAFMVLKTTGSPAKMGLVLFCSVFPAMVLGFIAGAYIDRYDRKVIIVGADAARGVIVSVLALLVYFDALTFAILLATQVLISVCTAFFDPAIPAIVPQIVDRDQLTRANSQTQLVSGISKIIGPTLGGLTVAVAGYLPVFLINAASYLISAVFESFIRLPAKSRPVSEATHISADIMEGCRYVIHRQRLLVILVMVGVIHFFVGSIEAVIPVLATGLSGSGAHNIGFIQTCFGIGAVGSALLISIKNISGKEVTALFGSVFAIGLVLIVISGIHWSGVRQVMPFLLAFFVIGGCIIFAGTSFRSILQKEVDDHMLGRVFGFVSSVGNISIPLAALVYGVLLEYVPMALLLVASGFVLLPTSILAHTKFSATPTAPQQQ